MNIYLDNAATTPIHQEVADEMYQVLRNHYGNPSSIHANGRVARSLIEESRKSIAKHFNASPGEIIFTSGGTESDNMAIRCSVDCLGIKHIITSKIEHHAVLHTVEELAKKGKIALHFVDLTENGHVDLNHLEFLLQTYPQSLVSLMHANNEIGNMIDLTLVGALCHQYQAVFHSDTVQTVGHQYIDLQQTKVDFIVGSAHKFNGPKGVGFIYINNRIKISPFITGGAQERNMRGGTENISGIVGMAKALELAYRDLDAEKEHLIGLKKHMLTRLKEEIPGVLFNGDPEGQSSHTVLNVGFPQNIFGEMLIYMLDIEGIACSGGSACSSGSSVGSHVLAAIGVAPDTINVRFSFGKQNSLDDIDLVMGKLTAILDKVNAKV